MIDGYAWYHVAFLLLIGHALADYPLQGEFVALFKDPYGKGGASGPLGAVWPWVLGSHALIHGGAVWFATGHAGLGFGEVVCHLIIDRAKCAKLLSFHEDQLFHLACKAAWLICWILFIGAD